MEYEITEHHDHSHDYDIELRVFEDVSYDVEIFDIPEDMYHALFENIEELWKDDCARRGDDAFSLYGSKIEDRSFWNHNQLTIYHEIKITCADEAIVNRTKNIIKPFFVQHLKETAEEMNET